MTLENGNKFTITAKNNSEQHCYIQSTTLNGENYPHSYIKFDDIQAGGELKFTLDENPNKEWGSQAEDRPYSLSTEK